MKLIVGKINRFLIIFFQIITLSADTDTKSKNNKTCCVFTKLCSTVLIRKHKLSLHRKLYAFTLASVSYTHLDVYKRQVVSPLFSLDKLAVLESRGNSCIMSAQVQESLAGLYEQRIINELNKFCK